MLSVLVFLPSVLVLLPLSSQFCILSNLFELSESSSRAQPISSAKTDLSSALYISLEIYPAMAAANFVGSDGWREPLRNRNMVDVS